MVMKTVMVKTMKVGTKPTKSTRARRRTTTRGRLTAQMPHVLATLLPEPEPFPTQPWAGSVTVVLVLVMMRVVGLIRMRVLISTSLGLLLGEAA